MEWSLLESQGTDDTNLGANRGNEPGATDSSCPASAFSSREVSYCSPIILPLQVKGESRVNGTHSTAVM